MSWQLEASCAGLDTEMFFPEPGQAIERSIKKMCAACPVNADCLAYALADASLAGVWAGTSERQRRQLRKRLVNS
jgi:WhiB family redox-sensing transcriptional regulator